MMKQISTLIFVLLCLPALRAQDLKAPSAKQESNQQQSIATQVERLVKDLGAKDFRQRENADIELRKLGQAAIPLLKKHLNHPDLETRTRVRALVSGEDEVDQPKTDLKPLVRSDTPQNRGQQRPRIQRQRSTNAHSSLDDFRKRMDDMFEGMGIEPKELDGTTMKFNSATSLTFNQEQLTLAQGSSGLSFTVKPFDKAATAKKYEAKDLSEFKKNFPSVYEKYKASGIFENAPLDFDVILPGQKLPPSLAPKFGKGFEERMKRLLDITNELEFDNFGTRFGNGGITFGRQEDFMKEMEKNLQDLFDRTGRGSFFRDLDLARRNRLIPSRRSTQRRLLGVEVSLPPTDVALEMAQADSNLSGLYVGAVTRGSLADSMGFRNGDVILDLDGKKTTQIDELRAAFQSTKPGSSLRVNVWRQGKLKTLTGTIPASLKERAKPPALKKLEKF